MAAPSCSVEPPWVSVERILETLNEQLDGGEPVPRAVEQGVFVVGGRRSILDGYVDGEVGIGVHFKARRPVADLEGGDFALTFEQAVLGDVHPFEAASGREVELRVPVGAPRGDDAEAAMAVLPRQIVDRVERLGGNSQS